MFHIPLHENRTLFSTLENQVCKSFVQLQPATQGYGIVANGVVNEVCRIVGLKDVATKMSGSRNPMNVVKACFDAFKRSQTPEELAKMRGLKVQDVVGRYYNEN